MTSPTEWAWVAGLFEGEGCIALPKKSPRSVRLVVSMTDHDVVATLHRLTGVGAIYALKKPPPRKPAWSWEAGHRDDVRHVLDHIVPWLHGRRRERAAEALARLDTPTRKAAA